MSECEVMEAIEAQQRARLLARAAAGESLASITRDLAMPSRPQVCAWLWADADFATAFRAARARGTDLLAEECLEIADEVATTAVEVADKQLRIDARLKLMARWQRVGEAKRPSRGSTWRRLTDEQLEVLASIPIVDGDPRSVPGGAPCASDDVFDDRRDVAAPPAPGAYCGVDSAVTRSLMRHTDVGAGRMIRTSRVRLPMPRPTCASRRIRHKDDHCNVPASDAPAQDPIGGRSPCSTAPALPRTHGQATERANEDRDPTNEEPRLASALPRSVQRRRRAGRTALPT